jgi:sugar lactone lactonase YvrE
MLLWAGCGLEPAAPGEDFEVLVADLGGDQLVRLSGREGACLGRMPLALDEPSSVAVLPGGELLVASFASGAIERLDADGRPLGTLYLERARLEEPVKLGLRDGRLYALGNDTANLVVLDPWSGEVLESFGWPHMRFPHDFAFGPDGLIYVAMEPNRTAGTVQIWRAPGLGGEPSPLGSLAEPAEVPLPVGLAFDGLGGLVLSDWWNEALPRFDASTHAPRGHLVPPGRLPRPIALELAPDGSLIAISQDGLVRVWPDSGRLEPLVAPGACGLVSPRGLAFRAAP